VTVVVFPEFGGEQRAKGDTGEQDAEGKNGERAGMSDDGAEEHLEVSRSAERASQGGRV
jgi:hypothetical protein